MLYHVRWLYETPLFEKKLEALMKAKIDKNFNYLATNNFYEA